MDDDISYDPYAEHDQISRSADVNAALSSPGLNLADANVVVVGGLDATSPDGVVQRRLKARHVQMIAIGGTIGTGLFIGSGAALNNGGPVGLLLGYVVMGTVVYSMVVALGEMTTLFPVSGSFTHYASRWLDPALGFALGYNYWYTYAITVPTQITAGAIVISYWDTKINPGAWITIFLVVIVFLNLYAEFHARYSPLLLTSYLSCAVQYYGEAEFWFSFLKVTTVRKTIGTMPILQHFVNS
jgi:amino acid transporter